MSKTISLNQPHCYGLKNGFVERNGAPVFINLDCGVATSTDNWVTIQRSGAWIHKARADLARGFGLIISIKKLTQAFSDCFFHRFLDR
ncbi:hypothetical protein HJC23_009809 [Cyclotella cryptica]|uniref:LAGLIDADG homing endonuclease n=1 Tax=Cyclotella cryptica TaxID=29204 RepID=A0ABD3PT09_9STRA